ncbi:hypothetical protein [Hydrogenophaga flava]|uniref:hypothetical protein n=1 Tax=Hydrogenophaga flava TaxID=65657 RepID=UPI0012FA8FF3|nr:hypothetical protein [Hydrogenophaga flava]
MAYMIQAIVTKERDATEQLPEHLRWVSLKASLHMLPLGDDAAKFHGIPLLPFTDEGETEAPSPLARLCEVLSQNRTIAYIEAEIFGGSGTQASVIFSNGVQVGQPIVADDAINQALRGLGVSKGNAFDEFEAVGLGRHRDTDRWLA